MVSSQQVSLWTPELHFIQGAVTDRADGYLWGQKHSTFTLINVKYTNKLSKRPLYTTYLISAMLLLASNNMASSVAEETGLLK